MNNIPAKYAPNNRKLKALDLRENSLFNPAKTTIELITKPANCRIPK
jgi:hypothetical protein